MDQVVGDLDAVQRGPQAGGALDIEHRGLRRAGAERGRQAPRVAPARTHFVAFGDQRGYKLAADRAACTCDEDSHASIITRAAPGPGSSVLAG